MTPAQRHPLAPWPRLRALLLDGSAESVTLLLLAAHGALARPHLVLIPDTGCYPASTYRGLDRMAQRATGIEALWVDAGASIAHAIWQQDQPCPLPLHTRGPDGTPGRLPNGCAQRQATAVDAALANVLGYAHPAEVPRGVTVDCLLATPPAAGAVAGFRRNRHPLHDLGWQQADCRAYLTWHGHDALDMACAACPNRGNAAWTHLAATDPEAWQEALAVDAALRHRPTAASGGMPPGATGYLHPARVPLAEVDLDTAPEPDTEGCVPRACRGIQSGTGDDGGGAA